MKTTVDKTLECLSCITKSERHSDKLKQIERSADGSLWDIVGIHRDLMVGADEIYLGKNSSTAEIGREIVDTRMG